MNRQSMKKYIWQGVVGFMLITTLTACLHQDPKARNYDEDGMLGITNTNPNLQTSPTHYNYSHDAELIDQALDQFPVIQGSRMIINGEKAYIKIRLPSGLTRDEIEQIESDAYLALSFQLPRYEVHLTSDKSNWGRNEKRDP